MTVSSPTNRVLSYGNGVTTVWPFSFRVIDAADMVVIINAPDGTPTQLAPTQYSVAGIGVSNGGSVTYPLSGAALAVGWSILIKRIVPYTQTADVQNQGGFFPEVLELAFDRIVFQVQQLAEKVGRALTVGDTATILPPLPATVALAGKFLAFDGSGNPTAASGTGNDSALRTDLANPAVGGTLAAFKAPGAGAITRNVTAELSERAVSAKGYVIGDGATNDAPAFGNFKTALDALTETTGLGTKYVPPAFVPKGVYLLNSDVTLPPLLDMAGRATGAGKLKIPQGYQQRYNGLSSAAGVTMTANFLSRVVGCYGDLTVNGGGAGFGSFWNYVAQVNGDVTLDLSNFSINFDHYSQVKTDGSGIVITGSGAGVFEGHANLFSHVDVTYGGIKNTASVRQTNWVLASYWDALAAADIDGPFHLAFFHGDQSHPPLIDRDHHMLFSTNVIEKNRGDFLSAGLTNLAVGGSWDYVDAAGKPPSLSCIGPAATVSLQTDEPFLGQQKYQATFDAVTPLTGFQITLPRTTTGRLVGVIAIYDPGGVGLNSIEINNGTTVYHDVALKVIPGTNWKIQRISINASTAASTTIKLYVNGGSPSAKTVGIGTYFFTQEKLAFLPSGNNPVRRNGNATLIHGRMTQTGLVAFSVVSGGFVDVVVPFTQAYSVAPFVLPGTYSASASATTTVVALGTNSATIRVFAANGTTGTVSCLTVGDA